MITSSKAASLYRSILKIHRDKLPWQMRYVGDEYVKNEFHLHKNTKNPSQLSDFYLAWEGYLANIKKSNGKFGKDLDSSEAKKLNEEQKLKLIELYKETKEN